MRNYLSLLLVVCTFHMLSCDRQDLTIDQERERILRNGAEFLRNNYDFSLFNAAIKLVGLDETLRDSEGSYTIFAPTNAAFNAEGIEFPSDFEKMDRDSLRFMLEYHILPTAVYLNDIGYGQADQLQENLTGRYLHLARGLKQWENIEPPFYVNGVESKIANNNVNLSNGVLHGLDNVLKYQPGTVREYLENLPDHGLFVALLKHFDYWNRIDDGEIWTIFAPTDQALIARGLTAEEIPNLNPADFHVDILLKGYVHSRQHILRSDLTVVDHLGGALREPSPGGGYVISLDDRGFSLSGPVPGVSNFTFIRMATFSGINQNNYKADNGVIHALSGMVIYPDEARRQ
ncbi:fasciclin domain-containing protein [Sphingobacterium haloxyli]|nr:fasciclin domain-containing protein [Sphingobacterium haloxyli]